MAIPGILPQQVDAQLQGQVQLPQGIAPQQVAPQQVQAAPQQLPIQPAPVPQQQQVQPQQQAEPPGAFGIPNSQLMKVFEKTKDPNSRLQAATFLGANIPAPTDEELDELMKQVMNEGGQ